MHCIVSEDTHSKRSFWVDRYISFKIIPDTSYRRDSLNEFIYIWFVNFILGPK